MSASGTRSPASDRALRASTTHRHDYMGEYTRDLDQVEFAEEVSGGDWRLYIGVSDVDSEVPKGSAIDAHAAAQTTSVYTGAAIFSMIPPELSGGATSLFEGAERCAWEGARLRLQGPAAARSLLRGLATAPR